MDAKLRAAIEATIKRWAKIATAEDPEEEYCNAECALCEHARRRCLDCPAAAVGDKSCDYPWDRRWVHSSRSRRTFERLAAWAVHDFAVSLLYQRED
jgi:hypothetical protein